ncbi:hypothetical protein KO481_12395 [Nocardia sp. NEAU-G5]|uniref:Uncharacterized protein n=1 Tax=Nocardia albiluteola TaxID=2842303 RepID=A0ABS6AZ94_9NOCA|nr:hypothetical protein [Nocardia albiluteola]MBU3062324.1 hypothetical protein [Nocardia albiluteola]
MSQDSSIRIGDATELAELLPFINERLATDQDARICLDRFAGRVYAAQSLRADLYRFTAVMLTNATETGREPYSGVEY